MSVSATLAVALAGAALVAPAGRAAAAPDAATRAAAAYLIAAQNPDGGLPAAPGGASSPFMAGWAAIGLAAAGHDPRKVVNGGPSLADYLAASAADARSAGDVERTLLALGASGVPPPPVLFTRLAEHRRADGSYDGRVNTTAFAVLALRAVGVGTGAPEVRGAVGWLGRQRNRDGGFGFGSKGGVSDADDTGAVLEALAAGGRRSSDGVVRRAVRWLVRHQRPDGGFALSAHGPSNAQSTAFAIQGLVAAGRSPARVRRGASRSPIAFLRTLVDSEGAISYSRTSHQTPVWVTAQALAALARKPLPITPPPHRVDTSSRYATPNVHSMRG